MKEKEYLKLKKKLIMALKDELLTPQELTSVLPFKTTKQLNNLKIALNKMYSDEEIVPVNVNCEKRLMLVRR